MKIGIFDSGIGGTTVMQEIKLLLPHEEYFYLADTKNCPYGEKSDKELYAAVTNIVNQLADWGAKLIVIACNTATTRCIKKLRRDYPSITFVGTEPAVKPATEIRGTKDIVILATESTARSPRLKYLINTFKKPGQTITVIPCPGLADAIESKDQAKIDSVLSSLLTFSSPDVIVLGCTHYPLVKNKIAQKYPSAVLIDGGAGVAKRVKTILSSRCS
ncbi:glutamate racemase [Candidatus Saccharibacteria bacterium]|nr:glutamate racemase [Candidatus Saccharibacteria bacterium]